MSIDGQIGGDKAGEEGRAPVSAKEFSEDKYGDGETEGGSRGRGDGDDRVPAGAMSVVVSHNIEKAMKILKRKLIKEGLFKELKSRRYYEKPSEKKKRKVKEARKKQRKEEARLRKGPAGMF